MTREHAIEVLGIMQRWRRGEPPYDDIKEGMPYSASEFGEAIDYAINHL